MVVVSNRIPLAKGPEEAFEQRWKNRKWIISSHPGFIWTRLLKPVKGDHYIVVAHWQSMKRLRKLDKQQLLHEIPCQRSTPESCPSQLEIHEIIAEQ